MAGAYCRFCGHRCFVYRTLPDRSWSGHMATCAAGAAHDHAQLGYDHITAVNPVLLTRLTSALGAATGLRKPHVQAALHAVLRVLAVSPVTAATLESYATFLGEETSSRAGEPR